MPRLHFQFSKQACWLISWFACFFLCSAVTAQAQSTPPSTQKQIPDFEERAADSISRMGSIKDKGLSESSGLTSAAVADAFWTINDSGHPSELFLFGNSGQKLAQVKLNSARNKDWESLASFTFSGQRWGLVADVGDNLRLRDAYQLYFFRDPTDLKTPPKSLKEFEKLKSVRALPIEFAYQDEQSGKAVVVKQDCEAVAVDPTTLDIWFVEKVHLQRDREVIPGVYVLPMPKPQLTKHAPKQFTVENLVDEPPVKAVAKRVGSFPIRFVSGMSFSPDGKKLIIRNYLTAHLYIRPDDKTWKQTIFDQKPLTVALPLQSQGEAICFASDSQHVILTSEGIRQPIWKIDLQVYFEKFKAMQ